MRRCCILLEWRQRYILCELYTAELHFFLLIPSLSGCFQSWFTKFFFQFHSFKLSPKWKQLCRVTWLCQIVLNGDVTWESDFNKLLMNFGISEMSKMKKGKVSPEEYLAVMSEGKKVDSRVVWSRASQVMSWIRDGARNFNFNEIRRILIQSSDTVFPSIHVAI